MFVYWVTMNVTVTNVGSQRCQVSICDSDSTDSTATGDVIFQNGEQFLVKFWIKQSIIFPWLSNYLPG